MYLHCQYKRPDLDIDFYPNLLDTTLSNMWCQYLDSIFTKEQRRTSILFGDKGIIYQVSYQGITKNTEVIPWDTLPALTDLKCLIEKITKQKYTVCAIQCYPTGKVGINPHRDKEMVAGTRIAGLSFGATRIIEFTRSQHESIDIPLPNGSLYVMNPPTNQKWLHCITKQPEITTVRYSMTFRDYA